MTAPPPLAALAARVRHGQRLVMLTAYDALSGAFADEAGADLVLVGESAATTVLGYATTREVPVDELLMLTRAVRRGVRRAVVVGDLPFGTYESDDAQAVATARRFVEAGADCIKLEGAGRMCDRVRAIVGAGIPVVGHVGLLPQEATDASQLKARGRTAEEALAIVHDARSLADAGISLLVVEAVPSVVAAAIVARVTVPVIGIGAGPAVHGQVLVYTDVLGISPPPHPRFVRRYASARQDWTAALARFAADVRQGHYPQPAEGYGMPDDQRERFLAALADPPDGRLPLPP